MMTSDIAEAADLLKFAAARTLVAQAQFSALHSNHPAAADTVLNSSPAAGAALANLRHLHIELSEAVRRLCPKQEDPEAWAARYNDKRPVIAAMLLDDGPGLYVHVWHPDPAHPMNNHCDLEVITTPSGNRKQVIVTAPGVIDAVGLPAADGQAVPAPTE